MVPTFQSSIVLLCSGFDFAIRIFRFSLPLLLLLELLDFLILPLDLRLLGRQLLLHGLLLLVARLHLIPDQGATHHQTKPQKSSPLRL